MCAGDAAALRSALLRFLQDRRAVVAAFVADGRQLAETGAAAYIQSGPLPPGAELPGAVRFFNTAGQRTREERFDPGLPRYCLADEPALPLGADTFAPLRIPQQQQNQQPTAVAAVTVSPPTPPPPPPTSVAPASPLQLRPPKPPSVPAPAAPLSKLRVLPPKPRVAPPAVPATKKHPAPAPPSSSPPHALLSLLPASPSPASAEAQAAIDELAALASFVPSTSKAAAATTANAGSARSAASDTPPDLASLAQSLMALGDPSLLSEQPESSPSPSAAAADTADLSALSSAAAALDGLGAHQFALPETSKTPQAAPQQAVDDLLALMDQAAQLDL